jgi:hypothetical protein
LIAVGALRVVASVRGGRWQSVGKMKVGQLRVQPLPESPPPTASAAVAERVTSVPGRRLVRTGRQELRSDDVRTR